MRSFGAAGPRVRNSLPEHSIRRQIEQTHLSCQEPNEFSLVYTMYFGQI